MAIDLEAKKQRQKARYQANREEILRKAKERYAATHADTDRKCRKYNAKTIYLYHNQEYIGKFNSIKETAERCGVSTETIRYALKDGKTLKNGFYPSIKELTQADLENLSVKPNDENVNIKRNSGCFVKPLTQPNIEYKVDCKDKLVCHLARSRNARVDQLKDFIYNKLWTRWTTINPKLATLEKQFIREICNSLR